MVAAAAFRVAVIADAHVHDITAAYGADRSGTGGLALRSLSETAKSLRVFNETGFALRHALQGIAARGIRDVVLLGDYSDDGQATTLQGLARLLHAAQAAHGLRFHALPGNHDVFATTGRHRSKRFLNGTGGYDLATSDPARRDPRAARVVVSPGMYCHGMPRALLSLPGTGLFGDPSGLHWETPFGQTRDPAGRSFDIASADGREVHRMMDASYLTEPVPGLWLVMLDANVWVPQTTATGQQPQFADSTDAGWDAMLRHKPFVLTWMRDVATRARASGKQVVTFSHYPVLDPFADCQASVPDVPGMAGIARRIPGPAVAQAVAATGLGLLVSGHLHLNATLRGPAGGPAGGSAGGSAGGLVNICVPSLAAFPAAYKVLTLTQDAVQVDTVEIGEMAMPMALQAAYRQEAAQTGLQAQRLLRCDTYGAFLHAHSGHLVARRYLRRDWPGDLAALIAGSTLDDLARAAGGTGGAGLTAIPALEFLEDWYRLRMGGTLAADAIAPDRLRAYRAVAALFRHGQAHPLTPLWAMFDSFLARLPSRNFTVDLADGTVQGLPC